MRKRYQEMVFSPDNYDNDQDKMFDDIKKFLQIALKNENVVVVRQEDFSITVLDYEHDEQIEGWGCDNPYWMTEEEYVQYIESQREAKEEESKK